MKKNVENEEVLFLQTELSSMGLDFPEFLLHLILILHWKYLHSKGLAPKNKEFEKTLKKLKEKIATV